MTNEPLGASSWTLRDMAQLRGMMRAGSPLRVAALRLGRSETAVRVKLIEMNGRLADRAASRPVPADRSSRRR